MSELVKLTIGISKTIPIIFQILFIAVVFIIVYKPKIFKKVSDKFVLRDECHLHVDALKAQFDRDITELKTDVRTFIDQVDKKVDLLLNQALRRK